MCPAYCNADLEYVAEKDCGDGAYCCGTPEERTCCTDYFDHLYDLVTNITAQTCANLQDTDGDVGLGEATHLR